MALARRSAAGGELLATGGNPPHPVGEPAAPGVESCLRLARVDWSPVDRPVRRRRDPRPGARSERFEFGRDARVALCVRGAADRIGAAGRRSSLCAPLPARRRSSGRLCRRSSPCSCGDRRLQLIVDRLRCASSRGTVESASLLSDFSDLLRGDQAVEAEVGAADVLGPELQLQGPDRRLSLGFVELRTPSANVRVAPIARSLPLAAPRPRPRAISSAPSSARSEPWASRPAPSLASEIPLAQLADAAGGDAQVARRACRVP